MLSAWGSNTVISPGRSDTLMPFLYLQLNIDLVYVLSASGFQWIAQHTSNKVVNNQWRPGIYICLYTRHPPFKLQNLHTQYYDLKISLIKDVFIHNSTALLCTTLHWPILHDSAWFYTALNNMALTLSHLALFLSNCSATQGQYLSNILHFQQHPTQYQ